MLSLPILNKVAFVSLFSLCAVAGLYAEDSPEVARDSRGAPREAGQRLNRDHNINQNRNAINNAAQYGGVGGYGGGVYYPQGTSAPTNYEPFPDNAQFQNTYERNQHPPQ